MTTAARGRTRTLAALALAAAGIAAGVWLTSAQESTRMTNVPAQAANQAQPVTTSAGTPMTAASAAGAAIDDRAATPTAAPPHPQHQQPRQQQDQQHQQPRTSGAASAGQRAFIDPVTGELRQPEHDELAAIAAAAAAAAPVQKLARTSGFATSAATESFGDDGSVQAVVPEDLHTFTVASRGPDGRIRIEHAQGMKQAVKVMNANSAKKGPQAPVRGAQVKEDRHDR